MELTTQLHIHTIESKGTRVIEESIIKPRQAIDIAKKNKIDVLAITDHNTTAAYSKIRKYAKKNGILLINGIEIDTVDGHMIGLDVDVDIDKNLKRRMTVLEAKDLIKGHGGEVYLPHLFDIRNKGLWRRVKEVDGIVEVFNSLNIFRFEDKYADLVASRLGKAKAVGADAHSPIAIKLCLTIVDSEPDACSILKAIKKGHVEFKNCRHLTIKDMKELSLERITRSYEYIKNEIKHGWEVDMKYMFLANNPLIKPLENFTLELGMKTKKSRIWDAVTYISYFLANIYGKFSKREFDAFIATI